MTNLPARRSWEGALDVLGFATTFYPGEVKLASPGGLPRRADGRRTARPAQGKLLLGGDAASRLIERGLGAEIGLASCEPVDVAGNCERFVNKPFAGKYWNQDEGIFAMHKYRLQPAADAIVVSQMIGPEHSFTLPGMVLYENPAGGRIGVIPFDGSEVISTRGVFAAGNGSTCSAKRSNGSTAGRCLSSWKTRQTSFPSAAMGKRPWSSASPT